MKLLALAWKDLRRQFRSGLLLLMMIGVPLLLTALLYFAFGSSSQGPSLQPTRVLLVDLDHPPPGSPVAVGSLLRRALAAPELAPLLQLAVGSDVGAARARVLRGEDGALLVVPAGATRALLAGDGVTLRVTTDPARPLGAGVVTAVVQTVADAMSAGSLAGRVTVALGRAEGVQGAPSLALPAATRMAARGAAPSPSALQLVAPGADDRSFARRMAGQVMAGMMIFFVFFSGAQGASAVLREQEEGTLARLASTPTSTGTQLGGRFLGIAAILLVQIALLLAASSLIFGIGWGRPLPVVLASLALAVDAAGFGVLLLAFVRTSRQSGPVFGVVLTVTGMVGGLMTSTMPDVPSAFRTAALFTPQGWAMELWRGCMAGDGVASLELPLLGTVALGAALLAVGVPLMRRRFARGLA